MTFGDIILIILGFLWELVVLWFGIFAAPLLYLNLLWIIIPIYLTWIFTDFFQERRGTSLGNAITNGAVVLWVCVDWLRQTVTLWETFSVVIFAKFGLLLVFFLYGMFIIIEGIKGRDFVTKFGRVRESAYIMLAFTPIMYGVVELTWMMLLSIIVGFPVFYYAFEMVDRQIGKWSVIQRVEEEEDTEEKIRLQAR